MDRNSESAWSPIKGSFPDRDKIQCKDCRYRDKSSIALNGEVIPVGVTKSFCAVYRMPPDSNGKPHEILFENANCKFYVKD